MGKTTACFMPHPPAETLFPSTRWSLLHRLREGSEEEARAALEALCRAYWQPLYCVARRRAWSEHDAQDAVQGFFEVLLRRETFATADEGTGKLRQLLLRAFDNFCTQQWKKTVRQKRGGGAEHVEISDHFNAEEAERHFQRSGGGAGSAEALYNREWANAVLERSLQALREDYARRGWQERYNLLVGPLLQLDDTTSLEQLAASAGMTAGALRVNLHRMRGHFRDQIERELAITIDSHDPLLIRQEMTELFKAFT
jgi:DNA-directed RNA polymerase specialized sigma24 family protein